VINEKLYSVTKYKEFLFNIVPLGIVNLDKVATVLNAFFFHWHPRGADEIAPGDCEIPRLKKDRHMRSLQGRDAMTVIPLLDVGKLTTYILQRYTYYLFWTY
jgi:hypothetical protein